MTSAHVCHIATMTQWGGVERILIDFLSHVDQTKISHSLLTTSNSSHIMTSIEQAGILNFRPSRQFHYDPTAVLQMAQWLRSQNVQIVHAYNAVGNAWGNLAALLAKTPIYISGEHGSVWRIRSLLYWLNRAAYRRAQCIIVNSAASKVLVCHKYQVDPRNVRVVYNIVAPPTQVDREKARFELGIGAELIVGSIGRLAEQKGYRVFIDAAKKILQIRTDIKFIIIGGGEQEADLQRYIQDLGIEDKFILTGWRQDARELLPAFDVFVSTSIYEPFGNVLIEAAMVGVPVIAPCVDGIPEAVADGITGKLLRPVNTILEKRALPPHVVIDGKLSQPLAIDATELAETILEFANYPDLRQRYGEAGQERAKTLCTVGQYINEVQKIYNELMG